MTKIYIGNRDVISVDAPQYHILEDGATILRSSDGRTLAIVPHSAVIVFGD